MFSLRRNPVDFFHTLLSGLQKVGKTGCLDRVSGFPQPFLMTEEKIVPKIKPHQRKEAIIKIVNHVEYIESKGCFEKPKVKLSQAKVPRHTLLRHLSTFEHYWFPNKCTRGASKGKMRHCSFTNRIFPILCQKV